MIDPVEGRSRGDLGPLRLVVLKGNRRRLDAPFFGRRLRAIVLIYLTGLISASAWIVVRILEQARGVRLSPRLAGAILRDMRGGSYYYLFAGFALLGSTVLILAAQCWSEERQERADPMPKPCPKGADSAGRREGDPPAFRAPLRYRQPWEPRLAAYGTALGIAFCAVVLLLTFPAHDPAVRRVFWAYAAAGTALGSWSAVKEYRQMMRAS
jgi:hypothetical protein